MACSPQDPGEVREVTQLLCDNESSPCPCPGSPIVIDVAGDGVELTSWREGVEFGLRPGTTGIVSWTAAGSDDAWLVLDRNGNGTIDDGSEMFGNFTVQPPLRAGEQRNGFRALGLLDANEDGTVDARDPGFKQLRLWRDIDHDAASPPEELFELSALGVEGLRVAYSPSPIVDRHGNRFAYRAAVYMAPGRETGISAWDVWLTGTVASRVDDAPVALRAASSSALNLLCPGEDDGGGGGGTPTPRPDLVPSIVTHPAPVVPVIYCVSLSWKTQNNGTAPSGTYYWGVYLNGMRLEHHGSSPGLAVGASQTVGSVICPPYREYNINTVTVYVNTQSPPSPSPPPVQGSVVELSYSNNFTSTSFWAGT